jgi:hypothetical protein
VNNVATVIVCKLKGKGRKGKGTVGDRIRWDRKFPFRYS